LFDTFAAYILKNTIFVGGFLVLAAVELGDGDLRRAAGGDGETVSTGAQAAD
jgi:hypothetical protein